MSGLTHEFSCKLSVTAERALAALTQAGDLTVWFAEHVEVEAHPGGAYRFWGKHTYGAPTRAEATQKLLRVAAPSVLAYSWTIHGRPSEVALTIEPDPEDAKGVIVKGKHVFADLPNIGRAKEMVDDLWRLQCGNLQVHVKVACPPDVPSRPRRFGSGQWDLPPGSGSRPPSPSRWLIQPGWSCSRQSWSGSSRGRARAPNQETQQTGHANDGSSSFGAVPA